MAICRCHRNRSRRMTSMRPSSSRRHGVTLWDTSTMITSKRIGSWCLLSTSCIVESPASVWNTIAVRLFLHNKSIKMDNMSFCCCSINSIWKNLDGIDRVVNRQVRLWVHEAVFHFDALGDLTRHLECLLVRLRVQEGLIACFHLLAVVCEGQVSHPQFCKAKR